MEEKLSGIRCLLLLPTVVLTVLVMGNFQTGLLFSVTANGAYIRGPLYLMMYMQAVWYGLVIGGESIRNYQKLGKRKFGIIWEILFIMVSCVLLQGFYQEVLLTGFAIALCLMVLLLAFQNPYVYTDNLTGLLDMQCFQEWAEEQCRRKRDIHVAVVDLRAAETAEYHLRGSMDRSFFEKDSRSGTGVYRKSLCLQNHWEKDTDRNVLF